ncbi:hypothetical protein [Methanimicrococcus hongohii]|uniref:hypothetical protein n=1 Tax=Methanimicrococcus hongohii TaxID=3028295 RepID=UPI002931A482|nr:hypothetical protein [Methanimicrococcus sp. Hf6]
MFVSGWREVFVSGWREVFVCSRVRFPFVAAADCDSRSSCRRRARTAQFFKNESK